MALRPRRTFAVRRLAGIAAAVLAPALALGAPVAAVAAPAGTSATQAPATLTSAASTSVTLTWAARRTPATQTPTAPALPAAAAPGTERAFADPVAAEPTPVPTPGPVAWSPAQGRTVTGPLDEVSVTFDDAVGGRPGRIDGLQLQVLGPNEGKLHFEAGCPQAGGRTVRVPVAMGPPGTYRISYQVVSAGGEVVAGEGEFDYEPAGRPAVADGSAAPVCVAGRVAAVPSAGSAPAEGASGDGLSGGLLALVAGVVALAIAAIAVGGRRARRRYP